MLSAKLRILRRVLTLMREEVLPNTRSYGVGERELALFATTLFKFVEDLIDECIAEAELLEKEKRERLCTSR